MVVNTCKNVAGAECEHRQTAMGAGRNTAQSRMCAAAPIQQKIHAEAENKQQQANTCSNGDTLRFKTATFGPTVPVSFVWRRLLDMSRLPTICCFV